MIKGKGYTYWVFAILFWLGCQIAAIIASILTLHEGEFAVTIEEVEEGSKSESFELIMAQVRR